MPRIGLSNVNATNAGMEVEVEGEGEVDRKGRGTLKKGRGTLKKGRGTLKKGRGTFSGPGDGETRRRGDKGIDGFGPRDMEIKRRLRLRLRLRLRISDFGFRIYLR